MESSELLQRYPVLHPSAAARTIEGEAVVVTPQDSSFHTLNDVGTRILALADGSHSGLQIVDAIVADYEVERSEAERDVVAFLLELSSKQILTISDGPVAVGAAPVSGSRGTP